MKDTSINELIILPYSATLCRYSVNDSESTHTTTYEKISEMISNLCPSMVMRSIPFLERKVPFYINIKNNEIFELQTNEDERNEEYKRKMLSDLLNPSIIINNNTKQLQQSQVANKFWRKK